MSRLFAACALVSGLLGSTSACVVLENKLPPKEQCGPKAARDDGMSCRCDTECKSDAHGGFCFAESEYAEYPRGFCYRECSLDEECSQGTACTWGSCYPRCKSTDDCARGRRCLKSERADVAVCSPFCDEPSDCESGVCDNYSGKCLEARATPKGAGLNAACEQKGECRSGKCLEGECVSFCDPKYQRCPENAVCSKEGRCVDANACSLDAGCDSDASCTVEGEDARPICESSDRTD